MGHTGTQGLPDAPFERTLLMRRRIPALHNAAPYPVHLPKRIRLVS
jgi:hypothetical protein